MAKRTTATPDWSRRITSDPAVCHGKPCIRGTRIPVDLILRKLGEGMTPEDVLGDHPHLTLEDIQAAQRFAADYIADFVTVLD